VDAVIVSDLGLADFTIKKIGLSVHLSTQMSCLNTYAAKFWKEIGVKRVVLGREVSISEAKVIKKEANIEVEMFIHGAMCMGYSGECVLSVASHGRDGNRGGCAHNCRFHYQSADKTGEIKNDFLLSSKDLCGISLIPQLAEAEIDALKIEGRMKGPYYVGSVTKLYAQALATYSPKGDWPPELLQEWQQEMEKTPHRGFAPGHLLSPAGAESLYHQSRGESSEMAIGMVLQSDSSSLVLEVRQGFMAGEGIELLPFVGNPLPLDSHLITSLDGQSLAKASPGMVVRLPSIMGAKQWALVRRRPSSP
ncbi:MAG: U32 family peptidase, partial [Pseudomonadota bacterium]